MFGFFKQEDFSAKINSTKVITVKAGDNLLAAALSAGLNWPHDCRAGNCGTCRCHLKKGKIKALNDFGYVLTPDELDAGTILACQTALKSEIEVEVELEKGFRAEIVELKGVLTSATKLTHDIMEVRIAYEGSLPQGTLAGQYMEVAYQGLSKPRSYSFARAPRQQDKEVIFYVRRVPKGEFTEWLFSDDRTNQEMSLIGPYGNFWLRETKAPMICIAGGSGMSALKAVLEHACHIQAERDIIYFFGAREQRDLYCQENMEDLRKKWNKNYSFTFVPVLSDEPEDSGWTGERGFVTTSLQKNYIDTGKINIADCEAYMCGPTFRHRGGTTTSCASTVNKFMSLLSMASPKENLAL